MNSIDRTISLIGIWLALSAYDTPAQGKIDDMPSGWCMTATRSIFLQKDLETAANQRQAGSSVITIPVVFHVVGNFDEHLSISEDALSALLRAVNRDFLLPASEFMQGSFERRNYLPSRRKNK